MALEGLVDAVRQFAENLPSRLELLDLAAQQEMALWAKWMFGTSVASVLLSGAALVALFVSLRQTRTVIQDTREIGEAQTRAFIVVKSAECSIYNAGSHKDPIDRIQFNIIAKVCGQSPAQDVEVKWCIKALFSSAKPEDGFSSPSEYKGGFVPGDEFSALGISWPVGEEHDEILMAHRAFEVRGEIKYRLVVGGKARRTAFGYYFGEHSRTLSSGERVLIPEPILEAQIST